MTQPLHVFAYGSLIDEPEWPDRIRAIRPARWPDHHRRLNLRSAWRGCPVEHAAFPHLVDPEFDRGEVRDSLVYGTAPAPGATLHGALVTWTEPDGSTLAALDRREGFDPKDPAGSPYLRRQTTVHTPAGPAEAFVYITNPEHPRAVELSVERVVRILLAATPRTPPAPDDRPRGAQYALPVLSWMRRHGLSDPHLDVLEEAIQDTIGPLSDHPHVAAGMGFADRWDGVR